MKHIALFCMTLSAFGCAKGPYAIVDGRIGASPPLDTAGVSIIGIDGRTFYDGNVERNIEPGFHALQVVSTRKREGLGRKTGQAPFAPAYLYLTVQPCSHYFIVARHESGVDETKWYPEIARAMPIEGCKADGWRPPLATGHN